MPTVQHQSSNIQYPIPSDGAGSGTEPGMCKIHLPLGWTFQTPNFIPLRNNLQIKFLDKEEFKDLRHLQTLRLDGNQLSVIIDELFIHQKGLTLLGKWKELNDQKRSKITLMAVWDYADYALFDASNKFTNIYPFSFQPQTFPATGWPRLLTERSRTWPTLPFWMHRTTSCPTLSRSAFVHFATCRHSTLAAIYSWIWAKWKIR